MPQVTVYIREADIEAWRAIDKKSQFMHDVLSDFTEPIKMAYDPTTQTVAGKPIKDVLQTTPPEPTYEKVPPLVAEPAPKLRVMGNDDLKELLGGVAKPIKDEPRHTCKENCKHWVWDTNRGGRTNTLTGEFQEGEPW